MFVTFVKVVTVAIIVPIDTVDEIRVFKDTVVVESFGVDAHSSFCLNTWGKGLSQVWHLKPLSVGERPPIQRQITSAKKVVEREKIRSRA